VRNFSVSFCMGLWLLSASQGHCEDATSVSVCDLEANPAAYDHKLIRITGQVSFGFEHFSLSSKECGKKVPDIWLAYGGTLKDGAIPNGREPRSEQPLTVEGITTHLIEDSPFHSFDALIHKPLPNGGSNSLKATLVGTYFAGTPGTYGIKEWRGFGMWGMYSLFVIQQVVSTEK
jgi:hypothetical protein